jgi:hypothetical protein
MDTCAYLANSPSAERNDHVVVGRQAFSHGSLLVKGSSHDDSDSLSKADRVDFCIHSNLGMKV